MRILLAAEVPPTSSETSIIESVLDFYSEDPWVLVVSTLLGLLAVGTLLVFAIRGIIDAGRLLPPPVSVSLVLGIVALATLVVAALRPASAEIVTIAGTAVGALAATVTIAWNGYYGDNSEILEQIEKLIQYKQEHPEKEDED